MGKFRQLRTELWPLIDVINSFSPSFFSIFDRFSLNLARGLLIYARYCVLHNIIEQIDGF